MEHASQWTAKVRGARQHHGIAAGQSLPRTSHALAYGIEGLRLHGQMRGAVDFAQ